MLIGITGGIGSGKTTLAKELLKNNFPVFFCDDEAKNLIATDSTIQQQLMDLLGDSAFQQGVYQTQYVAQKIFNQPDLLPKINAIVHPAVINQLSEWQKKHPICFVESAILYESGIDKKCDKVVAVIAPYTTRIRRVLHRDYTTCSQRIAHLPLVIKKTRNQLSNNQLQSMADFTLVNAAGKNISELFEDIKKIIATFAN